jgi:hypothetical protein
MRCVWLGVAVHPQHHRVDGRARANDRGHQTCGRVGTRSSTRAPAHRGAHRGQRPERRDHALQGRLVSPNGALDSACDGKGGILVRFPLRRFPEASKTPRVIAAPTPPRAAADTATSAALLREPAMVNRAKEFLPAARTPDNATMQCTDGTFIVADTSSTRCATRGGVLVRFAPNPRRVPR